MVTTWCYHCLGVEVQWPRGKRSSLGRNGSAASEDGNVCIKFCSTLHMARQFEIDANCRMLGSGGPNRAIGSSQSLHLNDSKLEMHHTASVFKRKLSRFCLMWKGISLCTSWVKITMTLAAAGQLPLQLAIDPTERVADAAWFEQHRQHGAFTIDTLASSEQHKAAKVTSHFCFNQLWTSTWELSKWIWHDKTWYDIT